MAGRKKGTPKTGGRKPGTPNKATADVKAAAQAFTVEAVNRLAYWMRSDNAKASVSAAISLLDRAHGKPAQAVTDPDGSPLGTALGPYTFIVKAREATA